VPDFETFEIAHVLRMWVEGQNHPSVHDANRRFIAR
jgi:hypothetical protein